MSFQYGISVQESPTPEEESQWWAQQLERFLEPYSQRLDAYLDSRTVGNLTATIASLLQRRAEVTVTELGAGITGTAHAKAGIHRLDRALHHDGWEAETIEQVLWEEAEKEVKAMVARGETPLLITDSSVWEKPESKAIVGKSAVRSSQAKRLTQYRPHICNRIQIPIRVPGYEWECLILIGRHGIPRVVAMSWWQRQKGVSGQQRVEQEKLLQEAARRFGRQVVHVYDRGYGHGPWLFCLARSQVRFVVRWKKGHKLIDEQGCERKTWEINRGKRAWGEAKMLWDQQSRQERATRVLAFPVRHPEYSAPLWVVVVRQGQGRQPWYLLTNEPVLTAEHAWRIVFTYVRRWKVEELFRVEKSELRLETMRLQHWDAQRNMLLLVTLACAFLFAMCDPSAQHARTRLLRQWCPRSDWRLTQAKLPVYRLRWALSALWTAHPPHLASCRPYRSPTHITWPAGSLRWWMTLWNQLDFLVEQVD